MLKTNLLTTENAKYHCRTCLINFNNQNASPSTRKRARRHPDKKTIDLTEEKELKNLISVNIDNSIGDDSTYPQRICSACFKKLQNFEKFRKEALHCAKRLQTVFNETPQINVEERNDLSTSTKSLAIDCHENDNDFFLDVLRGPDSIAGLDAAIMDDVEGVEVSTLIPIFENESSVAELNEEEIFIASVGDLNLMVDSGSHQSHKANGLPLPPQEVNSKDDKANNQKTFSIYRCENCKKRFMKKYHYDAHMLRFHEGTTNRPYACDQCDKSYKALNALSYHKYVEHKPVKKALPCEDCGKYYKTEASLKYHRLAQHLGQKRKKRIMCEICGAAFLNSKTLVIHKKAKHSETENGSDYKCSYCEKGFQTPYTLKYHILRTHTLERDYICSICEVGFPKKFMLASHMRTHTSEAEKFPCTQCEKRFFSEGAVDKHVRMVHLKIKPFVCKYCGDAFGTPKTLRHHTYIHTGEKPYVCDICEQSFRQLTAMKTHRNSVHLNNYVIDSSVNNPDDKGL